MLESDKMTEITEDVEVRVATESLWYHLLVQILLTNTLV